MRAALGYNHPGQLASVTVGGTPKGSYLYDYLSRLTSRSLPASSTTLHLVHGLDDHVIAEYDASGTLVREYVRLDDRPIAAISAGATPVTYFVHTDHLERPVVMTDASDAVVWRAVYLPYGEVHSITGAVSLDYRFPGQWFQLESGLAYDWHRHYDPTTGRYVQPDPLGMPDGPSRWAYAGNSPLMNVDPEGRQSGSNVLGGGSGGTFDPTLRILPANPLQCGRTREEQLVCACGGLIGLGLTGVILWNEDKSGGAEHTKGARPSSQGKHEKGQARKGRDYGGEKGDVARDPPRRKPAGYKGPWPPNE